MCKKTNIYMISDSTGDTVYSLFKAASSQFKNEFEEHQHSLIRNQDQLKKITEKFQKNDLILYSLVDKKLIIILRDECYKKKSVCIGVMTRIIKGLTKIGGERIEKYIPGKQHEMDQNYFERMEALNFAVLCDDGQNFDKIHEADVIIIGGSRTSKSPTCTYLANRNVKAANIPYVQNIGLPKELFKFNALKNDPFVVALIRDVKSLVDIRKNRLISIGVSMNTDYTDVENVSNENREFKKICSKNGWPIINVTNKSIEETSTQILKFMENFKNNV